MISSVRTSVAFIPLMIALLLLSTPPCMAAPDDALIDAYRQGVDFYRMGDLDSAIPELRSAVRLSELQFGDQSPELAIDLNNLAEALRRQGSLNEAEKLLQRARQIDQSQSQDETSLVAAAATLNNLGLVLMAKGRPEQALAPLRAALANVETARGPDDPDAARAAYNLALAEAAAGDLETARGLASRAAYVANRALGDRHPVTRQLRTTELRLRSLPDSRPRLPESGSPLPEPAAPPPSIRTASIQPKRPIEPSVPPPTASSVQQRMGETSIAGGQRTFAVQLMALRDEAALDGAWSHLRQRYQRLDGASRLPPMSIEVAGRGRFYRLLVGPYVLRADADALCDGLKHDGGECRVIIRN